jgi:DNA-binding beta-propeller fold protein YncE
VTFPVTPERFISEFRASEGITFNAEGRLFIGANRGVWIAAPDGTVRRIADVDTHLGQAGIGSRDILAADFGPTNIFRDREKQDPQDGVVWRITPEGVKTVAATAIADPNFVVVLRDGSWLVSDDGIDKIYRVRNGRTEIWTSAVAYPNGMALSPDDRTLYVAQIFSQLNPIVFDNRVWAIPLTAGGEPGGPPVLLARPGTGGHDGLAVDEHGQVYVADNGGGKIWRIDPRNGAITLIAEGMPHVASLAFGEGEFDHHSIYATSTERGGGTIWRVRVGVRGARLHR